MLWSDLEETTWCPVELESPSRAWERCEVLHFRIALLFPQNVVITCVSIFFLKDLLACAKFPKCLVLLKITFLNEASIFSHRCRVWFMLGRQRVYKWRVYICSQLVLGRHLGVLKPLSLPQSLKHYRYARQTETAFFKWRRRKKKC